ncbi:precorrin-2 dehydrogenase/sirohydrochlorin ferrochelatase family protein [Hazenella coriacea]|uniref:precorrin-2 dehydrogenase n=1 Tax=Hazenella coriacea TaxID=1179467 RepID=A0A4V2UVN6_9BACL|nr:bifunctional precorrin-2 dehydrogenase/sirohydrochlorin ferrochelatase [Hazenella coriacea]TCS96527.1 precorrin-2 dehydrogenase/sirohydrochlorin ferrochelatase [Hazenella coriacea]
MKHYYPMMVDLSARRCLVVGGGVVAERKVLSLVEAKADVIVVSPQVTSRLEQLALVGQIRWICRPYQSEDGLDSFLVIAATDRQEVNVEVHQDASQRRQWINVVDRPDLCNFTVPSSVKRGKLQISISTSGASPSLAKKIRHELEDVYGDEYHLYLDLMQEVREWIQREVPDHKRRAQLMKELVSDEWIERCRTHPNEVRMMMFYWIDQQISVRT